MPVYQKAIGLTGWYGRRAQETPLLVALPPDYDLTDLAGARIDELIIDLPPGLPSSVPALIAKADVVLVPVRASPDDLLAVPAVVEALAGHPRWAFPPSNEAPGEHAAGRHGKSGRAYGAGDDDDVHIQEGQRNTDRHSGPNLYGAFGVKRFSLSSAQSSILFKFLCSVGEPFLCPGLHPGSEPRGAAVNIAVGNRRRRREAMLTVASTAQRLIADDGSDWLF
jgi:hypothetical protein